MHEQSKLKHQLDVLFRVDSFMSTLSDLKQLLEQIMQESQQITDAEASSLALYDEAANDFVFEVVLGEKGSETKQIRVKYGEGIIGQAARTGKPQNIGDAYADEAFASRFDEKTGFKTRSLLAVPMFRRGRLIGVIEVLNKKSGSFTEEDENILEILAHQAAVAIENARLYKDNLAKERLACLGQGISGAAHCIKNLLSVVTLSQSSIDFAIEKNNKELLADSWDILKTGFERISAMVMDMLTYSKDRPPEFEPTQLNTHLASIFSLVKPKLAEKNIEAVQDFDSRIAAVVLDPKGIHRCIMNLVSNAIDAMDKTSGGRIVIKTRLDEPAHMLDIEVSDNGSGIPQESLEKIFEVFFSTKGSSGTGLGLSVTRKIIEEHGGTIAVSSKSGVGTTFTIRLPARTPTP